MRWLKWALRPWQAGEFNSASGAFWDRLPGHRVSTAQYKMPATNSTFWRDRAAALRKRAAGEEGERRQVLLVLADDCDEIAAEREASASAAR